MIQEEVKKRKIKHIFHFTKISNLINILEYGLLPRATLDESSLEYQANDEVRSDFCLNASCLSVSFPNYKVFYSYRMSDKAQEWVVLAFDPRVLWEKDCAFCYRNAASSEITCIPLEHRKKPESFVGLFEDFPQYPKRSVLEINDSYPTNPQAEILVFEKIEMSYLQGLLFETPISMQTAQKKSVINTFSCHHIKNAFYPRPDYEHWK